MIAATIQPRPLRGLGAGAGAMIGGGVNGGGGSPAGGIKVGFSIARRN
jgi:hypothetical protein